jgi:hypothetical protein
MVHMDEAARRQAGYCQGAALRFVKVVVFLHVLPTHVLLLGQ